MEILTAIAHIVGALITVLVFSVGMLVFAGWEIRRNQKSGLDEAALALGIPARELEGEKHQDLIIQYGAEKFSGELLRNRVSDLCGLIRTGWGWLGLLIQVGILAGVSWYTFAADLSVAINAWWMIAVAVVFQILSMAFSLICKFLTGRFPGQAKSARRALVEVIENQKSHRMKEGS